MNLEPLKRSGNYGVSHNEEGTVQAERKREESEVRNGESVGCFEPICFASDLDVILGHPMADILSRLALEPRLEAALFGRDEELQVWLDLAAACERREWDAADFLLNTLNLESEPTVKGLNESDLWARQIPDTA